MYRIAAFRSWKAVGFAFLLTAAGGLYLLVRDTGAAAPHNPAPRAKEAPRPKTWEFAAYEERLLKHQNLTYDELLKQLHKPRKYVEKLSFDPTRAEFFDEVSKKLALTPAEIEKFRKNGFVSLDLNAKHCMVSAYFDIFTKDLPVLVTTDSMLHALHRSFDSILMELENHYFWSGLTGIVASGQEELKKAIKDNPPPALADNCKDVDLFLTVAEHLLQGAGARENGAGLGDKLPVPSRTGVDREALDLLKKVENLAMSQTAIYGGSRKIDFTQFVPRGHYTRSENLKRYFRAMMWIGRADTGWFILPVDPGSGILCDDRRELRNAMLLVYLLDRSGALPRLQQMDDAVNFLIGRSDNLSIFQLREMMRQEGITTLADIAAPGSVKRVQQALRTSKHRRPMIVSLVLHSDPGSPGPQVPAPAQFQMFGQRFAMDSFVLSQVVFDRIVYQGRKMERRLPTGLDAMAALGNSEVLPLLRGELEKWNYSANLLACREFVEGASPAFWKDNLYSIWLDSLRTFNTDRTGEHHFPQAMKTQAWQRKELQTQLASWAELRHDTILYVKQSYSAASCAYPAGYVEPYPEFYARVKQFTDKAQELFADWKLRSNDQDPMPKHYVAFFKNFSEKMAKLEVLARKELKAEPFSKEETDFVKKTLIAARNCDGTPIFDGWYPRLYYDQMAFNTWEPTIADVHTDPMTSRCLEVGTGDANYCVIAVDNEQQRRVYVGPIYSYYEFSQPIGDRMTDEAWRARLATGRGPARPEWVAEFQAARRPPAPPKRR
jgi:hypothetical protein